ncbi:hypothetical protein [Flavobacterium sp.]|uniref:hypothetical protein n=1 Tax=Flavobacterium sp. TaxID=239 RepID=UPI003F69E07D
MKKTLSILAFALLFSVGVNAQEPKKAKKEKAKTEKASCSKEEKKSCGSEAKGSCCSSKKADTKKAEAKKED